MASLKSDPDGTAASCQAHALHVLGRLGYTALSPQALATERDSRREVILVDRLVAALKRLNPGLSEPHVHRALRELTGTPAPDLRHANQRAHTLLTRGVVIDQNGGTRRPRTVRYLDLQQPANNQWVVTWNFPVRGVTRQVVLDLVVFLNGIPLVMIQCEKALVTAPADPSWLRAALADLWRWQEADKATHDLGVPRLFETAQLLLALGAQTAVQGSVLTPPGDFATWSTPWPLSPPQVAALTGHPPTTQDLLLCGMLAPPNLFELLQNFVVFRPEPTTGIPTRTRSCSSEYIAVQQAAAHSASSGGVIWHALGGSQRQPLMMAWLVRKLRQDPAQQGRLIILVTEHNALLDIGLPAPQQISDSATLQQFFASAEPHTLQVSAESLHTLLDKKGVVTNETISPIVLITEVLGSAAAALVPRLRTVLPNACLISFTSTPVPTNYTPLRTTLGSDLSSYDFASAIADQAAVPVYFEARPIHTADRMRDICRDVREHFLRVVKPGGGAAQLVVDSAEAVRSYQQTLDQIGDPIPELFVGCQLLDSASARASQRVVYLDTPFSGQTLLQTVLSVNAPAADKLFALVIDYSGTSLSTVLQEFAAADVADALRLPDDEFLQLPVWHQAALTPLTGVKNLYSLEQCLAALEPPTRRRDLQSAFQHGARALELLLDTPQAQGFVFELRWLGQVLLAAAARYRDDHLSLIPCGPRVRQLIAEAVLHDGTQQYIERVPLLAKTLDDKLSVLPTMAAKVSEMFYALQYEIQLRFDEDPALWTVIRDQLAQILPHGQRSQLTPELVLQQLMGLRASIAGRLGRAVPLGLSPTAAVVYEALTGVAALAAAESPLHYGVPLDPTYRALAEQIDTLVTALRTDDPGSPDPKRPITLHDTITTHLIAANFAPDHARTTAERIVQRLTSRTT